MDGTLTGRIRSLRRCLDPELGGLRVLVRAGQRVLLLHLHDLVSPHTLGESILEQRMVIGLLWH